MYVSLAFALRPHVAGQSLESPVLRAYLPSSGGQGVLHHIGFPLPKLKPFLNKPSCLVFAQPLSWAKINIPSENSTPHAASEPYPTIPHANTPCSITFPVVYILPPHANIATPRVACPCFRLCPHPTPLHLTPKTSHHPRVPTFRIFLLPHSGRSPLHVFLLCDHHYVHSLFSSFTFL